MISFIEKIYCKSRLHAYIWRAMANRVFPDFISYMPPSPFALEIGTGQGLGAIFLSEKLEGSRFYAIDNEPDMVRAAVENVRKKGLQDRIQVEWGNALDLNFPDKTFDVVVAITVLHHVPHYEKSIAEAARVLKSGGVLFIIDFDFKASIFPRFELLLGRPPSIFSWHDMSYTLGRAGFETRRVSFYGRGMFGSVSVK